MPDDEVKRFMELFGVTEAEAVRQIAHSRQKAHEHHLERCARAEAAAHKRKDPAARPREGWRCIDISPAQHWCRRDDTARREAVFGKPMGPVWVFVVDQGGERIAEGKTGSMGTAMEQAEIAGTLAGMKPAGRA